MPDHDKGKGRAAEVLEVEDEEQRHERIHELFNRLNASSSPGTTNSPSTRFDFGDRSTFPVQPPLELLSRVQAFLPELAASNAELLRRAKEDPASVDIENVTTDQARYIEMNLGLGVFDHHGEVAAGIPVADVNLDLDRDTSSDTESNSDEDGDDQMGIESDSESSSESSGTTSSGTSSSTSSEDDMDDSEDDDHNENEEEDGEGDIIIPSTQSARPIRPLPNRGARRTETKPSIVVLSENTTVGQETPER